MRKRKPLIIFLLFVGILTFFSNINLYDVINLPENFYVNYEEIDKANKENIFGHLVKLALNKNEVETADNKDIEGEVIIKLFGFIPIKKVKVNLLPEEEVYLGGTPIGLSIHSQGVIVVSDTMIEENKIIKNSTIQNGDIIKEVNGKKIECIDDIQQAISSSLEDNIEITYQRNNKEKTSTLPLIKDKDGVKKLGVWVRDDLSGVGTLTFVKKENNQFAALGHAVTNGLDDNVIPLKSGEIYNCSLINIEKGIRNKPGELRCVFVQKNKQGEIEKNTNVGIYGNIENIETLVDQNKQVTLGGRLSVKPGKAKIVSNVSGINEEYDIEIIKANYQSKCSDKSLIIRVTDKRLLQMTGGIVQGMSGSPILQDGKLVGAVTHVFISDPTKGYGVYSDWMLEKLLA